MTTIIPLPPGDAVEFVDSAPARLLPPSPINLFVVGAFDRGTVGQAASAGQLRETFGGLVNYSVASSAASLANATGGGSLTVSRVTGPGATQASRSLGTNTVTVKAKSVGDYGNGLSPAVIDAGSGAVRIQVLDADGDPVATSPAATTNADLIAWSSPVVDVVANGTGAVLPAVQPASAMTGGTDDRANIDATRWAAALARLDRKYGPGLLLAPGATDVATHKLLLAHAKAFNRRVLLDRPVNESRADYLTYLQTMQADAPDLLRYSAAFGAWAFSTPVAGEPERQVPWSAVQAGIIGRTFRTFGLREAPFAETNGSADPAAVSRLVREWTDEDRTALYAAGGNVATDDGNSISTWGYRTPSPLDLHEDFHASFVQMCLKFDAEQVARSIRAKYVNADSIGTYHARLVVLCKRYQKDGAIYGTDLAPGFLVDTASVNTDATAAAREFHAVIRAKFGKTGDWVDLLIVNTPITSSL